MTASVGSAPGRDSAANPRSALPAGSVPTRPAHVLSHLRIVDRAVALRAVRLMGRLLEVGGRGGGFVPVDIWGSSYSGAPTTSGMENA